MKINLITIKMPTGLLFCRTFGNTQARGGTKDVGKTK
jgi:hypothetical protein